MRLALAGLLLIFAATAAEDQVVWGEPAGGLRLGIGAGPNEQLRLLFQNVLPKKVGPDEIQVLLGGMTAKGPIYNMVFRVKSPAGKESELFNFNGPPGVAGGIQPIVAHIVRGQKYEVLLPMKKFISIQNGKDTTLPDLLAAHFSVRAVLDTSGDPRQIRPVPMWMGAVTSGDFKR